MEGGMMMKRSKEWDDELYQLLKQLETAKPGKEARELHKKLKPYGHGLFLHDRYPNLPLVVSGVAVALNVIALIVKIVTL